MSVEVIRKAYQATEEGFLSQVTKQWPLKPQIAAVGSCCLVGVICGGTLYIANLGDSRAVLGRVMKATGEVLSIQLSAEHNVAIESVRQELHSLHPEDPQIVVLKHNVWRVKGLIQVSLIQCKILVPSISFVTAGARKENLCVAILCSNVTYLFL
jgi:pyruvate dehydrogenase phosphatase